MNQTKSTRKLKIIPGRGLTGLDIKKRLKNRTLNASTFGEDAYLVDEKMLEFTKMSKVEQIEAIRQNQKNLREIESKLDSETSEKNKRLEEQRIEREVNKRLSQMSKENERETKNKG